MVKFFDTPPATTAPLAAFAGGWQLSRSFVAHSDAVVTRTTWPPETISRSYSESAESSTAPRGSPADQSAVTLEDRPAPLDDDRAERLL
jgi:hypothetical protein